MRSLEDGSWDRSQSLLVATEKAAQKRTGAKAQQDMFSALCATRNTIYENSLCAGFKTNCIETLLALGYIIASSHSLTFHDTGGPKNLLPNSGNNNKKQWQMWKNEFMLACFNLHHLMSQIRRLERTRKLVPTNNKEVYLEIYLQNESTCQMKMSSKNSVELSPQS